MAVVGRRLAYQNALNSVFSEDHMNCKTILATKASSYFNHKPSTEPDRLIGYGAFGVVW